LKTRKLGKDGPEVSQLGLGCMGMSDLYGSKETRDDSESLATINLADLVLKVLERHVLYSNNFPRSLFDLIFGSLYHAVEVANKAQDEGLARVTLTKIHETIWKPPYPHIEKGGLR
jgi:hypothetical protein